MAFRLRQKTVVDRRGAIRQMGELVLENRSSDLVDIAYNLTPLQHLDLDVFGPDGTLVSEGSISDFFSPTREPGHLRLSPGESFVAEVPLLATVPRERRLPGRYTVEASYRLDGWRIAAAPLAVEVEGVP